MKHIPTILITATCLIATACRITDNKTSSDFQFEAHLVESPADRDKLYDELGFSYTTLKDAEEKIVERLDAVYATHDGYSSYPLDNDELKILVMNDPATMTYDFPLMQERGYLNVVSSDDGNLRLYYWNTFRGGTMIIWSNLCQFLSNDDKVYAYGCAINELDYTNEDEFSTGCEVLGIHSVAANNGETYYLVHTYTLESAIFGYQDITPVKIDKGRLISLQLFEGNSDNPFEREQNPTGREYYIPDWYFRANDGEGWDWLFSLHDNTLYVPELYNDIYISDQYSLYAFNGDRFIYIGKDGGFWLHPSLRKFEFLEDLFLTRDYRIRVDRLHDGTYRYASWKRSSPMNYVPDLVIHNGTFNEENWTFSFENEGYMYLIHSECNESTLSIYHDGERLLFQKQIIEI